MYLTSHLLVAFAFVEEVTSRNRGDRSANQHDLAIPTKASPKTLSVFPVHVQSLDLPLRSVNRSLSTTGNMSSSSAVSSPSAEGLSSRKQASNNHVEKDEKQEPKTEDFPHSLPIHIKPSASILSKDSTEGLSFRGFGNLACSTPLRRTDLVLVMVFGNLRLIVENYVKVQSSTCH